MPRAQSTQSPYKPRKQMQRMGPEDDLGVEGVGQGPDEEGGGEATQLEQAPHVRHLRPDTNACWRFGAVLWTAACVRVCVGVVRLPSWNSPTRTTPADSHT